MTHDLSSRYLLQERGKSKTRPLPRRRPGGAGRRGLVALLGMALALTACALTGSPTLAQGNAAPFTLQIDRSVSGNLVYWFATGANTASPVKVLKYQPGASSTLSVPDGYQGAQRLRVLNVSQGRAAHLNVNHRAVVPLTDADFTYAETVQVPVTYRGKPAQGLLVTLDYTGDDKLPVHKTYWLQATDGGIAHFTDVPTNKTLRVSVSDGANLAPEVTGSAFKAKASAPYAFSEIEAPSDWTGVQTTDALGVGTAAPLKTEPGATAPAANNNSIVSIVTGIIVLMLLVAVVLFWLIDTGRLKPPLPIPVVEGGPSSSPFQPVGARPTPIPAEALVGVSGSSPVSGPRLVATLGSYAGSIFPLTDNNTGIGRDIANTVALAQDSAASRRHAHIQANNGQFVLVDDGSSNGTYVNGIRIASQNPKPLRPGDEVQIGTTRFRFEV